MSRIQRAFERRFRQILAELGARKPDKAIALLLAPAATSEAPSLSHALTERNIRLANALHRLRRRRSNSDSSEGCPKVICDAGLGGLARWLRASGCDTHWVQDIADPDLVASAQELGATIITTDSFLLDRRPIASGQVPAIWVPPTLTKFGQLRLVRAELNLPDVPDDSRCMRCGGELIQVEKEKLKDRIPPKTYLWIDEYWLCSRCDQLYWHGTHWRNITKRLQSDS